MRCEVDRKKATGRLRSPFYTGLIRLAYRRFVGRPHFVGGEGIEAPDEMETTGLNGTRRAGTLYLG